MSEGTGECSRCLKELPPESTDCFQPRCTWCWLIELHEEWRHIVTGERCSCGDDLSKEAELIENRGQ